VIYAELLDCDSEYRNLARYAAYLVQFLYLSRFAFGALLMLLRQLRILLLLLLRLRKAKSFRPCPIALNTELGVLADTYDEAHADDGSFGTFGLRFRIQRVPRFVTHLVGWLYLPRFLLVLLVNDSEYSQSTGAKPIFRSLLAVFISFPLARCAPLPTPPPLFGGGKVPKKNQKKNLSRYCAPPPHPAFFW
jgi:hypothetical protein